MVKYIVASGSSSVILTPWSKSAQKNSRTITFKVLDDLWSHFWDSLDYYDQVFECFATTKLFDNDFESMHMEA